MTPFPQDQRMRAESGEDTLFARWSLLAAGLLLAAVFGFLSCMTRDVPFSRVFPSADKTSNTPHLGKRDPPRALAAADRKDGGATHSTAADGSLVPRSVEFSRLPQPTAKAVYAFAPPGVPRSWRGLMPRAPPGLA